MEGFRKYFENKENRTRFGQIGNKGGIQDTADMWLMSPRCLEPFTMMEYSGGYVFSWSHISTSGPLHESGPLPSVLSLSLPGRGLTYLIGIFGRRSEVWGVTSFLFTFRVCLASEGIRSLLLQPACSTEVGRWSGCRSQPSLGTEVITGISL